MLQTSMCRRCRRTAPEPALPRRLRRCVPSRSPGSEESVSSGVQFGPAPRCPGYRRCRPAGLRSPVASSCTPGTWSQRCHVAVREGHVEQREQPRAPPQVKAGAGSDASRDSVPLQGGAFEPEPAYLGLIGGALAGSRDAAATEALDLIEVRGVLPLGQRVRRTRTNCALFYTQWRDVRPSRREREVETGVKRHSPGAVPRS